MAFEANKIKEIYEGNVGKKYDLSMSHFFVPLKKKAFNASSLKANDRVLVFCCGTGLDFQPILEKIGPGGEIIGVDFSTQMLEKAKEKVQKYGWKNVQLIQADVTDFENKLDQKANVGVCSLGLSLIPDFKKAYCSLLSNIKDQGEVIIGDMQLASGWKARFNPFTLLLSKKYGGTAEGHQNSLELKSIMKMDLAEVKIGEFLMNSYYFCIGKKINK